MRKKLACDASGCVGDTIGDGVCDHLLNCGAYDNDGSDCCPEGQVKGCTDTCVNGEFGLAMEDVISP